MAQKVVGLIKLQIPAGKATPAPPVGPALGQHGVNIVAFTKDFNERTKNDIGLIIPVVITVYADRSFTFITKTPPAAVLLCQFSASPALHTFDCTNSDNNVHCIFLLVSFYFSNIAQLHQIQYHL